MEHRVRVNLMGAAGVVALGAAVSVVTSSVVASRAYVARERVASEEARTIDVKGYARTRVRSDMGTWKIQIRGNGPTLAESYAVLESGVKRLEQFLADNNFEPAELDLGPISTTTHHERDDRGRETETVSAYTLDRTLQVTSTDVDRIAQTAGRVTQLLRDNVLVISRNPEFVFTGVEDVKIKVAGEASADARSRADEIASKAGCRVTEVRSARMGVIQITEPHSTAVSSYGIYDTSTIDKDVSVVVTLTLALDA